MTSNENPKVSVEESADPLFSPEALARILAWETHSIELATYLMNLTGEYESPTDLLVRMLQALRLHDERYRDELAEQGVVSLPLEKSIRRR
jgi:hypothetical protein